LIAYSAAANIAIAAPIKPPAVAIGAATFVLVDVAEVFDADFVAVAEPDLAAELDWPAEFCLQTTWSGVETPWAEQI